MAENPPRNNASTTRGRPFKKGNSGRPKGARHKTTQAILSLMDGEAEGLTRKAIELALDGDMTALKLCIERLAPPPKDAPVSFRMPMMNFVSDAVEAQASVLSAVACGDLTPSEGERVCALIEGWRKAKETADLEARVAALETATQE